MSAQVSTTPRSIRRHGAHDVEIIWGDGHTSLYPARFLRLNCRCAVCVDEVSGRPLLDPAGVPEDVHPVSLQLVGRYAVQPIFSDGHNTGIFTFEHLRAICPCPDCQGRP
jgi:ATP-binding protein involved in chromosome partitioning